MNALRWLSIFMSWAAAAARCRRCRRPRPHAAAGFARAGSRAGSGPAAGRARAGRYRRLPADDRADAGRSAAAGGGPGACHEPGHRQGDFVRGRNPSRQNWYALEAGACALLAAREAQGRGVSWPGNGAGHARDRSDRTRRIAAGHSADAVLRRAWPAGCSRQHAPAPDEADARRDGPLPARWCRRRTGWTWCSSRCCGGFPTSGTTSPTRSPTAIWAGCRKAACCSATARSTATTSAPAARALAT